MCVCGFISLLSLLMSLSNGLFMFFNFFYKESPQESGNQAVIVPPTRVLSQRNPVHHRPHIQKYNPMVYESWSWTMSSSSSCSLSNLLVFRCQNTTHCTPKGEDIGMTFLLSDEVFFWLCPGRVMSSFCCVTMNRSLYFGVQRALLSTDLVTRSVTDCSGLSREHRAVEAWRCVAVWTLYPSDVSVTQLMVLQLHTE